ncbi:hypothetical protein SDC9_121607 [bioreactor metagenome]|uniref:Uncharacterized protein n=1 Tax=bioreactor metagenome TaxID=1076179 RepID=A0A645CCF4_9ZZZZ
MKTAAGAEPGRWMAAYSATRPSTIWMNCFSSSACRKRSVAMPGPRITKSRWKTWASRPGVTRTAWSSTSARPPVIRNPAGTIRWSFTARKELIFIAKAEPKNLRSRSITARGHGAKMRLSRRNAPISTPWTTSRRRCETGSRC